MKPEPLTKDKIGLLPENYSDKCIFIGDVKSAVEWVEEELRILDKRVREEIIEWSEEGDIGILIKINIDYIKDRNYLINQAFQLENKKNEMSTL